MEVLSIPRSDALYVELRLGLSKPDAWLRSPNGWQLERNRILHSHGSELVEKFLLMYMLSLEVVQGVGVTHHCRDVECRTMTQVIPINQYFLSYYTSKVKCQINQKSLPSVAIVRWRFGKM